MRPCHDATGHAISMYVNEAYVTPATAVTSFVSHVLIRLTEFWELYLYFLDVPINRIICQNLFTSELLTEITNKYTVGCRHLF